MSQNNEVIQQSMELSETIKEGLNHIDHLMNENKHLQSLNLMEDVLTGILTIEQSFTVDSEELSGNDVNEKTAIIRKKIEEVVGYLEQGELNLAHNTFTYSVIVDYDLLYNTIQQLSHNSN